MIIYNDLEPYRIGVVHRFGQEPIACYDYQAIIEHYQRDGMTEDEAVEYFEYNVIGAWVGDTTPCFLDTNASVV